MPSRVPVPEPPSFEARILEYLKKPEYRPMPLRVRIHGGRERRNTDSAGESSDRGTVGDTCRSFLTMAQMSVTSAIIV